MEQSENSVRQWIDDNAHALSSLEPDASTADLQPLREMLDQAVVVGLGESTRAGRELFHVRLRIFAFLVEELGFRALAVQDNEVVAAGLDAYVQTGAGDPREALAEAWMPWRTAEMAEALEWIRAFNLAHDHDPVRIFGLEAAGAMPVHYDEIAAYVSRVAPEKLDRLQSHYDQIRTAHDVGEHVQRHQGTHPGRPFVAHARDAYSLVESLPESAERARMLQYAQLIVEFHDASVANNFDFDASEQHTAEVIARRHLESDVKIAYWDGIGHTNAAGSFTFSAVSDEKLRSAGGRLRSRFGERYVSVGIGFHHGEIHDEVVIPAPPADFLEATVATAGPENFYLDLRAPAPSDVAAWLKRARKTRVVSGVYDPAADAAHHLVADTVRDWFDLLVHVRAVTPTRLLQ